jgi:mycofactocin precursor
MDTSEHDALENAPHGQTSDEPAILEEIEVEDLSVDGICGVY